LLFHRARPAFLFNVAPIGKLLRGSRFRVALGEKKKKLHALFHYPDLRDPTGFLVIEYPATQSAEIGEFRRHFVVFQIMLHKKQIAQSAGIRPYWVEQDGARRTRDA